MPTTNVSFLGELSVNKNSEIVLFFFTQKQLRDFFQLSSVFLTNSIQP